MANNEIVPTAEEIIMALDKHPELRAAVHKLLGPSLPGSVLATHHSINHQATIAGAWPSDTYTIDVQFTVYDRKQVEPMLRLLRQHMRGI